jgi:glycosyltransferase involved in cell wall biosynthesis
MKICLITDTWDNVNGVVTTLKATVRELEKRGHEIAIFHPGMFKTFSMPRYPEIKMSWNLWKLGPMIEEFDPDAIHIATEGPLGCAARWYCKVRKRQIPHNTSYHTKFPEYLKIHHGIPVSIGYWFMRLFHKFSCRVLVTTSTVASELEDRRLKNLVVWNRGVDHEIFNQRDRCQNLASKPVLLCVSRASYEKGLDDFCSLSTSGTKILVGDGPYLKDLKIKYPDVIFTGYKTGVSLSHYYANADVFVFPSKSDTFGVVMLESIACGTPVAAYPVTGPIDVLTPGVNGEMNDSLSVAVELAQKLNRDTVEASSHQFTWAACTDVFEKNLVQLKVRQIN